MDEGFFVRTSAILALAVLVTGGAMLELDGAHIIGLNQQLFNVLFIAIVMPVCVSCMMKFYFDKVDRKNAVRIQSLDKG